MKKKEVTRRNFIATVSAGTAAAAISSSIPAFGNINIMNNNSGKLAILGGTPVSPGKVWPKWPYVDEKVVEEIVKTTRSGIWCRIQSPNGTVPTFENELAKYVGIGHAVALSSGTAAIHLALKAVGVGPGDIVFCPSLTFSATANPIIYQNATPVIIDSDFETWNMSPVAQKMMARSRLGVLGTGMSSSPPKTEFPSRRLKLLLAIALARPRFS